MHITSILIVIFFILNNRGDAPTHDILNLELLHDFHIFNISYEKLNFRKIRCLKVNKYEMRNIKFDFILHFIARQAQWNVKNKTNKNTAAWHKSCH